MALKIVNLCELLACSIVFCLWLGCSRLVESVHVPAPVRYGFPPETLFVNHDEEWRELRQNTVHFHGGNADGDDDLDMLAKGQSHHQLMSDLVRHRRAADSPPAAPQSSSSEPATRSSSTSNNNSNNKNNRNNSNTTKPPSAALDDSDQKNITPKVRSSWTIVIEKGIVLKEFRKTISTLAFPSFFLCCVWLVHHVGRSLTLNIFSFSDSHPFVFHFCNRRFFVQYTLWDCFYYFIYQS